MGFQHEPRRPRRHRPTCQRGAGNTISASLVSQPEPTAEASAAAELVRMAREKGWSLAGPDGLRAAAVIGDAACGELVVHGCALSTCSHSAATGMVVHRHHLQPRRSSLE